MAVPAPPAPPNLNRETSSQAPYAGSVAADDFRTGGAGIGYRKSVKSLLHRLVFGHRKRRTREILALPAHPEQRSLLHIGSTGLIGPQAKDGTGKCEWTQIPRVKTPPFARSSAIRIRVSKEIEMERAKKRTPYRLRRARHKGLSRERSRVPKHAPLSRARAAVAWRN